jgi:hypothetical protein
LEFGSVDLVETVKQTFESLEVVVGSAQDLGCVARAEYVRQESGRVVCLLGLREEGGNPGEFVVALLAHQLGSNQRQQLSNQS